MLLCSETSVIRFYKYHQLPPALHRAGGQSSAQSVTFLLNKKMKPRLIVSHYFRLFVLFVICRAGSQVRGSRAP